MMHRPEPERPNEGSPSTGLGAALRSLVSWRTVPAVLIFVAMFEVVARTCPLLLPRTVHQPFLHSVRQPELIPADWLGTDEVVWSGNSRGARGSLVRNEPLHLAILGSSTSADTQLSQADTWARQLETRLVGAHVDNFASDDAWQREARRILTGLNASLRPHLILLQVTLSEEERDDTDARAFRYWGQWASRPGWIQADWMLRSRISHQLRREERLGALLRQWDLLSPTDAAAHRDRVDRDRALREEGRLRFTDEVPPFPAERIDSLREEARALLDAARAAADHVVVLLQPIAYDEEAHPGVASRWVRLKPSPTEEGVFRSNRSVALEVRRKNEIVREVAEAMDLPVLDVDGALRPHLRSREDLFYDRWHYLPAGATLAAEFIAGKLEGLGLAKRVTPGT